MRTLSGETTSLGGGSGGVAEGEEAFSMGGAGDWAAAAGGVQ